jgi:hypothetical protein
MNGPKKLLSTWWKCSQTIFMGIEASGDSYRLTLSMLCHIVHLIQTTMIGRILLGDVP